MRNLRAIVLPSIAFFFVSVFSIQAQTANPTDLTNDTGVNHGSLTTERTKPSM